MTDKEILALAKQCEVAAACIVGAYGRAFPISAMAFDVGGGSSKQDTSFSRQGTSDQERQYTLPTNLAQLIEQNFLGSQISPSLSTSEASMLQGLLDRVISQIPGLNVLQDIQGIDPTGYAGNSALATMISRNPYSQDYEKSTADLYNRSFNTARAAAQSGPGNVRGGQARMGFDLADLGNQQSINRFKEVRGQQDREAGVVQGAVQLANTIEGMRRGSKLQATGQQMEGERYQGEQSLGASSQLGRLRGNNAANLSMASEFLGKPRQRTTDNLTGLGQQIQNNSQWGAGITCCFIFLEALNGQLPTEVRRGRDEFGTKDRINGYKWMASWLVPWMKRSRIARWLVNTLMVKPFITHGKAFYGESSILGWSLLPLCWAWLWTWGGIGRIRGDYD